eukprot:13732383-Alexandrium_andersonii.AAC.1
MAQSSGHQSPSSPLASCLAVAAEPMGMLSKVFERVLNTDGYGHQTFAFFAGRPAGRAPPPRGVGPRLDAGNAAPPAQGNVE